jgi:hypothetical protein
MFRPMSYVTPILRASLNNPRDLWERKLHRVEPHNVYMTIKARLDK